MMFGTQQVLQAGGGLSHICAVCMLWSPWGPSTSFKADSQEGDWQHGEETALGRSESSGSGLASSANLCALGKALCRLIPAPITIYNAICIT